jgi:aerobic-type carbon monoxide dehydrogenase small subunit (CoxS/CutS family)
MSEEKKKKSGEISRREFLKDAGLIVGGAAIGSTVLLAACGGEETTKTVTTTAPGGTATVTTTVPGGTETVTTTAGAVTETQTVTSTAPGGTVTSTVTESVSKFVCPIDGQEFDSLAELQAHFEAVHPEAPVAALNVVKLTVNGYEQELQVTPQDTLRDVLREKLGLISIKEMCTGQGACGSCTIIMDGRPVLSCMVLAIESEGVVVETAEGIADANHPVVDAYIMNQCMQCGYCTPGFLVTSKALLDHNPNPTEADIREILGGNICRCGTYPAHIIAVLEAAGNL